MQCVPIMIRTITCISLLCLCVGSPFTPVFAKPPQKSKVARKAFTPKELFERCKSGVVSIETDDGNGSGFLVENGSIAITCAHVIEGATRIKVVDYKGRTLPVIKVSLNRATDTAVLLVARYDGVKPLSYINTDKVNPGDPIIVIGNPLGFLSQTLTTGIVSGKRKDGEAKLIQIDAAISPGSSGSPIINVYGEVVGMVSFSFKRGQSLNMGVAFSEIVRGVERGYRTYEQFLADNLAIKNAAKEEPVATTGRIGIINAEGSKSSETKSAEASAKELAMRFYGKILNDSYKPVIAFENDQSKWTDDLTSDETLLKRCIERYDAVVAVLNEKTLDEAPAEFRSAAMKESFLKLCPLMKSYTDEVREVCLALKEDRSDDFKAHAKKVVEKGEEVHSEFIGVIQTLRKEDWFDFDSLYDSLSAPVIAMIAPNAINTIMPDPGIEDKAVVGSTQDDCPLQYGDIITKIKAVGKDEWTPVEDWTYVVGYLYDNKLKKADVVVSRDGKTKILTVVFYEE